MEGVGFFEGKDEGFEEFDGGLDIIEVGGFHDGVHAAERKGNEG